MALPMEALHVEAPKKYPRPVLRGRNPQVSWKLPTARMPCMSEACARVHHAEQLAMQRAANQAVRDGTLHGYDRRHGWRGKLDNILDDQHDTLESYEDDDWHWPINKGDYVTGLVTAVDAKAASIKIGQYHALLYRRRISPGRITQVSRRTVEGGAKILAEVSIKEINGNVAHVQLEQNVGPQAAMVAIDNPTGEIKAMVGGYSFEESKFNRVTQAQRQVGSSFKIYVYSCTAMEQGYTPFDTILDAPVHHHERRPGLFPARITMKNLKA